MPPFAIAIDDPCGMLVAGGAAALPGADFGFSARFGSSGCAGGGDVCAAEGAGDAAGCSSCAT
jgi:hypothetical protein